MKHPHNPDELNENNSFYHEYFSNLHISDFIDKKYFQNHPMISFKPKDKTKKGKAKSPSTQNIIENDPIANNPNNFFFNKGLELLSNEPVSHDQEETV